MPLTEQHEKYLGLPTVMGRSKTEIFRGIRERVWRKMQGLQTTFFGPVGREGLIKAVVQAVPPCAMGCFKFPDYVTRDLESLMSNFWW